MNPIVTCYFNPTRYELHTRHELHKKRQKIASMCDVLVDGRYIDKLRDVSLQWRGSSNQRVIDVKQTLQKGEIVLWAT